MRLKPHVSRHFGPTTSWPNCERGAKLGGLCWRPHWRRAPPLSPRAATRGRDCYAACRALKGEIYVIEHGRDFPGGVPHSVVHSRPLRVLVLGDYQRHKGSSLIESVLELDGERSLVEFHVFGKGARDPARPGLVVHPTYRREAIAELGEGSVRRSQRSCRSGRRPTRTRSPNCGPWACPCWRPTSAPSANGSPRMGGWLVPAAPEAVLEELRRIASAPTEVEERSLQVLAWQQHHCGTPEISRMAEEYDEIYTSLFEARPRPAAATDLPGRLRVGLLLKERRPGAFYATAYVRLLGVGFGIRRSPLSVSRGCCHGTGWRKPSLRGWIL